MPMSPWVHETLEWWKWGWYKYRCLSPPDPESPSWERKQLRHHGSIQKLDWKAVGKAGYNLDVCELEKPQATTTGRPTGNVKRDSGRQSTLWWGTRVWSPSDPCLHPSPATHDLWAFRGHMLFSEPHFSHRKCVQNYLMHEATVKCSEIMNGTCSAHHKRHYPLSTPSIVFKWQF